MIGFRCSLYLFRRIVSWSPFSPSFFVLVRKTSQSSCLSKEKNPSLGKNLEALKTQKCCAACMQAQRYTIGIKKKKKVVLLSSRQMEWEKK